MTAGTEPHPPAGTEPPTAAGSEPPTPADASPRKPVGTEPRTPAAHQPAPPGTEPPTRAVLGKAAHENFPVAPFFLPRAWREDLMAVYGYARLIDDIGDGDLAPGGADAAALGVPARQAGDRLVLLDAAEEDLRRVTDGTRAPRHPLIRALGPAVRRHGIGPGPFLDLIEANRRDQHVRRYATYEELLAYCELSANPVGRLVLAVTGTTTPQRVRRSDAVCTALQITEHLQDVAEDLRRHDRIYLPAEDMRRYGVEEDDLRRPAGGAPVRELIAFETRRARLLLDHGAPLVGSVHGRLKLLLAGFVAGGRAALGAIAAAGHDPLPGPPRHTGAALVRETVATLRRKG